MMDGDFFVGVVLVIILIKLVFKYIVNILDVKR